MSQVRKEQIEDGMTPFTDVKKQIGIAELCKRASIFLALFEANRGQEKAITILNTKKPSARMASNRRLSAA